MKSKSRGEPHVSGRLRRVVDPVREQTRGRNARRDIQSRRYPRQAGQQEAKRRADGAYDALAGRRLLTPWGWLAAAGLVGAAFGWVATIFGRQLMPRQDILDLPVTDEDFADTRKADTLK